MAATRDSRADAPGAVLRPPVGMDAGTSTHAATFAVAIPCCNESQNVRALIGHAAATHWRGRAPARVFVVSDASVDGTDEIVRELAATLPVPIELETSPTRRGKAAAVNRIVEALADVTYIVLVSADAMPQGDCIPRLLDAVDTPGVGVAAARPVAEGPDGNAAVAVSRLLWALHHEIAQRHPKSSEILALRRLPIAIPVDSHADEAALEVEMAARGHRAVYVPDAIVRTNAPLSLLEYVRQRTRVTFGHLELARATGYVVGTLSVSERLRALRAVVRRSELHVGTLLLAAALESLIYVAAWARSRGGGLRSGVWATSASTKRPFGVTEAG